MVDPFIARDEWWLLPEGIEELLPDQAEHLERLRRDLLDLFAAWGNNSSMPSGNNHHSSRAMKGSTIANHASAFILVYRRTKYSSTTPAAMLSSPVKRRRRLSMTAMVAKTWRIMAGLAKGNMPSIIRSSATADNKSCHIFA